MDLRTEISSSFFSKNTVSTRTILELLLLNKEERKNSKNGTFATAHFRVELFSSRLLGNSMSLADHKSTQRGRLGAFSTFVVEFCVLHILCVRTNPT